MLQEVLEKRGWGKPAYQSTFVPVESMPCKFNFRAEVSFVGERFESIKGFDRKKDAEQDAAHNALKWIAKGDQISYVLPREADSGEDGDNLVNSKVRVWWGANDQKFSEGFIVAFDSIAKTHKVVFKETLNLRNTKWELVGKGSKSDEQEATQWLSSDHFREMSSRKRIKTNSKANGCDKGKEIKKTEGRTKNEMVKAVESHHYKKMSSKVDTFLESLDLEKYSEAFKKEEVQVDMTTLAQMTLEELHKIVPMELDEVENLKVDGLIKEEEDDEVDSLTLSSA
ncbi:hypothetical protein Vadar_002592 [Vaccinium darrowii]|uniref:Uncharacterized protein n=1 Tax=Vaccinium darrowii TaxID=229202 RepID=A0ACB7YJY0_9ERIC|nr:hypothetical protein Vadar_002592 [Vaccinium darrowii]